MTIQFQLMLIIISVLLLVVIIKNINKSRVIFSDFNYWVLFVVLLIAMSLFPKLIEGLAQFIGVMNVVNAVFLIVMFALILLVISLSFRLSQLKKDFIKLTQQVALIKNDIEKHEDNHD